MNERYAVDPEAPSDARQLKLLLDQFGLETGRFLSSYPDYWSSLLLSQMERASPMERARAFDVLSRRRAFSMPATAPYEPKTSWSNNAAVASERHRAFGAVIGQAGNGFGWTSVEQVLYEDDHALPSGVGAHVPMQVTPYMECLRPLFLASAEVFLVDRFFTLRTQAGQTDRRRWPVLLAMLKLAEETRTCEVLRLVLERDQFEATSDSESQLEDDLQEALDRSGTNRIRVEYEIRDSVGHGRYIFSLHGGLQFDQGFETSTRTPNHVHWLSRPELDPLLQRFGRRTSVQLR